MSDEEPAAEQTLVTVEEGQAINDWKVLNQIGAGNYGNVYHVERMKDTGKESGAMKVESLSINPADQVLKIEALVMKNMAKGKKKDVIMLLASGKRSGFQYIVMTLVGPDLTRLVKLCGGAFSPSTTLLIAIRGMYALKQMHDVGYVHRDVKPCNFAISASNPYIIVLIDFGMTRRFAELDPSSTPDNNKWKLIPARKSIQFRGTICYCSGNMHLRKEQGRQDDLLSLLYVCIDLHLGLPWHRMTHPVQVEQLKQTTTEEALCEPPKKKDACTKCFIPLLKHLRKIEYFDRPDYSAMFKEIHKEMTARGVKMTDPYDWDAILKNKNKKKSNEKSNEKSKSKEKTNDKSKERVGPSKERSSKENIENEEKKEEKDDAPDKTAPLDQLEEGEGTSCLSKEPIVPVVPRRLKTAEDIGTATEKPQELPHTPPQADTSPENTNFGRGVDHAIVLQAEFDFIDVPGGSKHVRRNHKNTKKSHD